MSQPTCQTCFFRDRRLKKGCFFSTQKHGMEVSWVNAADLINRSESWGRPHWSWAWQHVGVESFLPNTYTSLNLFPCLFARCKNNNCGRTNVCRYLKVTHTLNMMEWVSQSLFSLHLLPLNFIPLSVSLSIVTALNFYFALCLSASMFFILSVSPSLLFPLLSRVGDVIEEPWDRWGLEWEATISPALEWS